MKKTNPASAFKSLILVNEIISDGVKCFTGGETGNRLERRVVRGQGG